MTKKKPHGHNFGGTSKQKTHTYQRLFTENPKERIHQLLEDYKEEYGKVPTCNAESDLGYV